MSLHSVNLNEWSFMTRKPINLMYILTCLLVSLGCQNRPEHYPEKPTMQDMSGRITKQTLQEVLDAFNRHDLDAIMSYFSEDCSFDFPRGPMSYGQRHSGKEKVRDALASRFTGIPDVHYGEDIHWISDDGKRGVSEWALTGTTTSGVKLNVRGCDLWEFEEGKIKRKDSYWKIVE